MSVYRVLISGFFNAGGKRDLQPPINTLGGAMDDIINRWNMGECIFNGAELSNGIEAVDKHL